MDPKFIKITYFNLEDLAAILLNQSKDRGNISDYLIKNNSEMLANIYHNINITTLLLTSINGRINSIKAELEKYYDCLAQLVESANQNNLKKLGSSVNEIKVSFGYSSGFSEDIIEDLEKINKSINLIIEYLKQEKNESN